MRAELAASCGARESLGRWPGLGACRASSPGDVASARYLSGFAAVVFPAPGAPQTGHCLRNRLVRLRPQFWCRRRRWRALVAVCHMPLYLCAVAVWAGSCSSQRSHVVRAKEMPKTSGRAVVLKRMWRACEGNRSIFVLWEGRTAEGICRQARREVLTVVLAIRLSWCLPSNGRRRNVLGRDLRFALQLRRKQRKHRPLDNVCLLG